MDQGFDIIIVSTQNSFLEEFWQKRLRSSLGKICKPDSLIISVAENWKGGAGTGLGTLYAYTKAQEKAKYKYHQDLFQMHRDGASVALYHTAGFGKKLFPLIASENNSIANLKLPSNHGNLLETIIKQTNQQFSENREGRLSVFHCDQLFFPSKSFKYHPESHLDLYCQTLPLSHSGKRMIVLEPSSPIVFETSERIEIKTKSPIASNLSTFSLSLDLTFALINEFKEELEQKTGQFDANAHFWMPLTLDYKTFLSLNPYPENQMHFHRMAEFKKRFVNTHSSLPFVKALDMGEKSYWWDFRTTRSYYENLLKLTRSEPESHHMRLFFGINSSIDHTHFNRVIVDQQSCLIDSEIRGGSIKNSVLIGVQADTLEVENCVIINSSFTSLKTSHTLLYQVKEDTALKLAPGTIRSDVQLPHLDKEYRMYSHLERNGISDWNTTLPQNPLSFSAIHQLIENRQEETIIG